MPERDSRRAQGRPARRGATVPRGHQRGGLPPADRGVLQPALFLINAEVVGLLATLAARACPMLDRRFSRRGFWPMIEQKEITWINAMPAIITVLAMDPPATRLSGRVRFVRSASAPLAPSTLRRFEEAFGIPVLETYGMTEAASMITANPLDGPRQPGYAGLAAGAEIRIVAPEGERAVSCRAFAVGQVHIRGRGVIREYAHGAPDRVIRTGAWLDTGDLGYLGADGYLFLAGRSDDVINRGGEKVYPKEIEDFLLAQPGVPAGAGDEVLGQRPVACVVPAGSWPPNEMADALRRACDTALPRSKRPTVFHVVHELRLGPAGKAARRRVQGQERGLAAATLA
ncbi:MAG: AMP-binding protein [Actinomycetota bacterium]|nr:AMP-binding protein [Actinomycetota bacterium]